MDSEAHQVIQASRAALDSKVYKEFKVAPDKLDHRARTVYQVLQASPAPVVVPDLPE